MSYRRGLQSLPKLFGQDQSMLTKALFASQENIYGQYQQIFDHYQTREASTMIIKQRMRSIKNIEKITKAMKMVASSRMRRAQVASEQAAKSIVSFYRMFGDYPGIQAKSTLIIPVCTDKGLCGGLNTSIIKMVKTLVNLPEIGGQGKEVKILTFGDKGRSACTREFPDKLLSVYSDIYRQTMSFSQASELVDQILKHDFEKVYIVYNHFASAISFKPTIATLITPPKLNEIQEMNQLFITGHVEEDEIGKDELQCNLFEFQLTNVLMHALSDNHCSEFASRVQAMDSSSKNAGEILDKLTLQFNRSRQATITTELIEIISGAEALKG